MVFPKNIMASKEFVRLKGFAIGNIVIGQDLFLGFVNPIIQIDYINLTSLKKTPIFEWAFFYCVLLGYSHKSLIGHSGQ